MQESIDDQMTKTAEPSGATVGSADGSTPSSSDGSSKLVEPIQPLEVPEIKDVTLEEVSAMDDGTFEAGVSGKKYIEKHWKMQEAKKLLSKRTRARIVKNFIILRYPQRKKESEVRTAESYFENEFPQRSPYSVYQKAWKVARNKYKRIVYI